MNEDTRKSMASSASENWCTPTTVLDKVRKVNNIALDPCSNVHSVVNSKKIIIPPDDGLSANWKSLVDEAGGGLVYVNPPYGRKVSSWVRKCVLEYAAGCEIVLLVGARTETKWFQNWIFATAQAVCFWKGRITFVDGENKERNDPAFFPSAVAYWGLNENEFISSFKDAGQVFRLD
jgi:site-specific DNA-methyltransferase (adenine-specific)